MKKTFILLTAFVMLAGLSLASPVPDSETGFSVIQNGHLLQVVYKSRASDDVKVSIFNSKNQMVFNETLKGFDGFNRPYNFEHLTPGKYRIQLEDRTGRIAKIVEIPKYKKQRLFNLEPVHGEDGKFMLRVSEGSRGFSMTIFDKYGKELYHESKSLDGDFAKVYNFSKIRGEVSVVVADFNGNESKVIF